MTDDIDVAGIAGKLTKAQMDCIVGCEEHGNARYVYQLHGLANKRLMTLTPVPELLNVPAYRLSPLGLAVREHLLKELRP